MLRTVRGWLIAAGVVAAAAAVVLFTLDGESPEEDRGWMPSRPKSRSVVWAVGDAADGSAAARQVASMVASHRVDRLLYLGDVYATGTAHEFEARYRPLYGRLGPMTAPTIGNHEWPNVATG